MADERHPQHTPRSTTSTELDTQPSFIETKRASEKVERQRLKPARSLESCAATHTSPSDQVNAEIRR